MLLSVPVVSAEPISILQEAIPQPVQIIAVLPPIELPDISYGVASWYSKQDKFIHIHTANGEIFDDSKLTCASWDFDFGTSLEIKNLSNDKSVICRVNDRGPAKHLHRSIDLTNAAFREIADPKSGLIRVSITKSN